MSGINGEQGTEQTKLDVIIDGKPSKGFIDIVKTLENLGAYLESSVELLGRFEEKINNIGTATDNINKKTKKYSASSVSQVGKRKKAVTVLNDIPTDNTPAGKEGVAILKAQKELINSQKELTKALEESVKASANAKEVRANALSRNAATNEFEAPSRVNSRNSWTRLMAETEGFRNVKNNYEREYILSGRRKRDDDLKQQLLDYRATRDRLLVSKRGMNPFSTWNLTSSFARGFSDREMRSREWQRVFPMLGSLISGLKKENVILNKEGALGELPFSGVSKGALLGSVLSSLSKAVDKLARAGLNAYGSLNKLETSLGVVFGSDAQAGMVFEEIKEYAVKSPFGVAQITEMATLLKQSGVYESDLMDTLKIIGDLAGGNEEKYRRIANNYAQTLAIGKVTTKDMREFANAGIPIFDATAKYLGISRKDLSSQIENGKVTAQVIENVFKQLTSEGGLFYKATERGAETYAAKTVNFEDMKQLALSEVGEFFYESTNLVKGWMDIKTGVVETVQEVFEAINIREAVKELDLIEADLARTNEILESGELTAYDQKLYEDQKQRLEAAYTTDDKLKILNDSFLLQKESLEKMVNGNLTVEEAEQRIALLEKKLAEVIKEEETWKDLGEGAFATEAMTKRISYQDELYGLNYDYLNLQKVRDNISALYSSAEGIAHTMILAQQQYKASQDFFNKQAANNEFSSINVNDRLNEMYKGSDIYRKQQQAEEKEFLRNSILAAERGEEFEDPVKRAEKFSELSDQQKKDIIKEFFKASEVDVFKGGSLTQDDVKFLLSSFGFAGSLNWDDVLDPNDDGVNEALDEVYKKIQSANNGTVSDRSSLYQALSTFVETWSEKDPEMLKYAFSSLEYTGIDKDKALKLLDEIKDQEAAAATPFWARLAGDIFGWDPAKLEWTSYRDVKNGYNHSYGLTAYKTGVFEDKTRVIPQRGGMFDKNGVAAILEASGSKYLDSLKFAYNADGSVLKQGLNGIEQYDWSKSFEALEDIAMSLESSVKVSDALASFYTTEREKFTSYLTSGIIKEEDWEKLTDEAYKEDFGYIGEEWEQLTNRLSTALEEYVDENGEVAYRIKSEGMRYALEMEKLLKETEALTTQFSSLKGSIASLIESTEQTNLKRLALSTSLFGEGLSSGQQESLAETAYNVLKDELSKLGLDEKERKEYLAQSTEFIKKVLSGDTSDFNEQEKSLSNAILEMINATKVNTSALIGLGLTKNFSEARGLSSFDAMSFFRNGEVPVTNLLGETGQQQRILSSLGVKDYSYNQLKTAMLDEQNADILKQMEEATGLKATEVGIDKLLDQFSLLNDATAQFDESLANIANGSLKAFYNFAASGVVNTFETIGKSLVTSETASENLATALKSMFQNLAGQISTLLVTEGLRTMGAGAVYGSTTGDWSKFYTGLGMVAAGGFGSILSGMMKADSEDNKADEEVQRLQTIKDMLADLLTQARIDAEYYEKNLRHQKAISANDAISSYTKVNDAIITPRGDVISTHPDDWLIATKTPHELGGGSAPVVTITIVNESGNTVQVARTEQQRNGNNIDIKAVVVAVMNEAVADGSLDSGLAMYQQRQRGKVVNY